MDIYRKAAQEYGKMNVPQQLVIRQYEGGHALTAERVAFIIKWICEAGCDA